MYTLYRYIIPICHIGTIFYIMSIITYYKY